MTSDQSGTTPTSAHPDNDARKPVQLQNRLDPTAIKNLVEQYKSGATVKELTSIFNIHRATVSQHLNRNGIKRRPKGLSIGQIDKAKELYSYGLSLRQVGEKLGVDGETVRRAFIKNNHS